MSNHIKDYKLPEDIKSMDENSLELLSTGIRAFLIDTISKTGGHLASNLGVVEISVGLHKIFDFPRISLSGMSDINRTYIKF